MSFSRFFSKQARRPRGLYGRFIMSRIFEVGNARMNDFVFELMALQETDHVLEIGSGTGKLLKRMSAQITQGSIEGVDFSNSMISLSRKRNKKKIAKGILTIKQGDFNNVEYDEQCFDKICSVNTIYFWPDPEKTIQTIYRILKRGGSLFLGFEEKAQMEKKSLSPDVFRFYTTEGIKVLLSNYDFAKIDVKFKTWNSYTIHCAVATKS